MFRNDTPGISSAWLKRSHTITEDISAERLCRPKKLRQTISDFCRKSSVLERNSVHRSRGLSLLARKYPGRRETNKAPEETRIQPFNDLKGPVTRRASILDLPNELLSQILLSGASSDWFFCLDYELFRAFRNAHPGLRQFALAEIVRLNPELLDGAAASCLESEPCQLIQERHTFSTWLVDTLENPDSLNSWDIMPYNSLQPDQFFDSAISDCPAALFVKRIPLFADDVYLNLSVNNRLSCQSSTQTATPWSRLREVNVDCHITDIAARYILSRASKTLEVASFNLKPSGFSPRTPIQHSFNINHTHASKKIIMEALHSLTIDTCAPLQGVFDGLFLPSLRNLQLVSYPTPGCFGSVIGSYGQDNRPILNPTLNIPWSSIKNLVLRDYESSKADLNSIVARCSQLKSVELTGVQATTQRYPTLL